MHAFSHNMFSQLSSWHLLAAVLSPSPTLKHQQLYVFFCYCEEAAVTSSLFLLHDQFWSFTTLKDRAFLEIKQDYSRSYRYMLSLHGAFRIVR